MGEKYPGTRPVNRLPGVRLTAASRDGVLTRDVRFGRIGRAVAAVFVIALTSIVSVTIGHAGASGRIERSQTVLVDASDGSVQWQVSPGRTDEKYEARVVARSIVIVDAGACGNDDLGPPTHVVALDAKSGAVRWRSRTALRVVGSDARREVVLAQTETQRNRLFALDLDDGGVLWDLVDTRLVGEAGDVVVVNRGRSVPMEPRVEGRDRRSGELLWTLGLPGAPEAAGWQWVVGANQNVAVIASVLRPLGSDPDGTPHFSEPTTFIAVDTRNGEERWRRDFEPVLLGDRAGVVGSGVLAFVNRLEILGVDLQTGAPRWAVSVDPSDTIERTDLFGPADGVLVAQPKYVDTVSAISLASGQVEWSDASRSLYEPYLSNALGRVAVIGTHRSNGPGDRDLLSAVDTRTGEALWTESLESDRRLWPIYGRDVVAFSSYCNDTFG